MGFYLVPLSATYFSVVSFFFSLNFCVCGLLFTGWRTIVLVVYGAFPQLDCCVRSVLGANMETSGRA